MMKKTKWCPVMKKYFKGDNCLIFKELCETVPYQKCLDKLKENKKNE